LQHDFSNTDYHVTRLAEAGLLVLVYRRPVRGANDNFYRLT
jgi:hypothetical protein